MREKKEGKVKPKGEGGREGEEKEEEDRDKEEERKERKTEREEEVGRIWRGEGRMVEKRNPVGKSVQGPGSPSQRREGGGRETETGRKTVGSGVHCAWTAGLSCPSIPLPHSTATSRQSPDPPEDPALVSPHLSWLQTAPSDCPPQAVSGESVCREGAPPSPSKDKLRPDTWGQQRGAGGGWGVLRGADRKGVQEGGQVGDSSLQVWCR